MMTSFTFMPYLLKEKSFTVAAIKAMAIKPNKYKPTKTDIAIKSSFWNEHRKALILNSRFSVKDVILGICSNVNFHRRFIKNQNAMNWLIQFDAELVDIKIIQDIIINRTFELIDSDDPKLLDHQVRLIEVFMRSFQPERITPA